MGWSRGSGLMGDVVDTIQLHVKDDDVRYDIYSALIEAFAQYDADTLDECCGVDDAYDAAFDAWNEDNDDPDED